MLVDDTQEKIDDVINGWSYLVEQSEAVGIIERQKALDKFNMLPKPMYSDGSLVEIGDKLNVRKKYPLRDCGLKYDSFVLDEYRVYPDGTFDFCESGRWHNRLSSDNVERYQEPDTYEKVYELLCDWGHKRGYSINVDEGFDKILKAFAKLIAEKEREDENVS